MYLHTYLPNFYSFDMLNTNIILTSAKVANSFWEIESLITAGI